MKKAASILVVAGLLAVAPGAVAKSTSYVGKTSSGHKITFKLRGNRIVNPTAGIGVTCLPIQGGGSPKAGVDYMYGRITGKLRVQYSYLVSKYPIGTFYVYSCLGTATYKARPKR